MKRIVLLVKLLSFAAFAADPTPTDAPVREFTPCTLDQPDNKKAVGLYILSLETENAELKKGIREQPSPAMIIALSVGSIIVVGAAAAGVGYAVGSAKKP